MGTSGGRLAAREKGGPEKGAGDGAKRRGCGSLGRGMAAEMPDGRRAGVPVGQAGAREGLSWHSFCAPTARGGARRGDEKGCFYLSSKRCMGCRPGKEKS
ncbi:hypothetical protein HMPREF0262_01689 [Clostridium sp. ATCC 29733]|nr:hypothetical protein HMPREF0262_01689 [Clostridium sp. ATCC 29733]